jgi:hypothetical protein
LAGYDGRRHHSSSCSIGSCYSHHARAAVDAFLLESASAAM